MRKRRKIKPRSILEPFDVSQDVPLEPIRMFVVKSRERNAKGDTFSFYETKYTLKVYERQRKNKRT